MCGITCNKIIIVQNLKNPPTGGESHFPLLKRGGSGYSPSQIPWPLKRKHTRIFSKVKLWRWYCHSMVFRARRMRNFFLWQILSLGISSLAGQQCLSAAYSVPCRWQLSCAHRLFPAGRQKSQGSLSKHSKCPDLGQNLMIIALSICLSALTLNPTYPMRLTDCGEAAPYWLGATQLKAGGSYLVRCNDLSHHRK